LTDSSSCDKVPWEEIEVEGKNMATVLLYLIGPAIGVLIFIIGIVTSLITGSGIDFSALLRIAFGVALMTEFCVLLSVMEEKRGSKENG